MNKLFVIMLILSCGTIFGQEPVANTDLKWNRYKTENFAILSIDNDQGKYLSDNIEKIKSWCLTRWGFPDSKFTKECRIFCTPDKATLQKLFSISEPKFETNKDLNVIWISLDEKPTKIIPPYLTQIILHEFELKHKVRIGWWFKRGSAILNGAIPEIKTNVSNLHEVIEKNQPIFFSEDMFTMTEEQYGLHNLENRKVFDCQAVAMCILLRKEFGEAKLQGFLRICNKNNSKDVLRVVYNFESYSHFDRQYIRFMKDLTSNIKTAPDHYLEIKPVR